MSLKLVVLNNGYVHIHFAQCRNVLYVSVLRAYTHVQKIMKEIQCHSKYEVKRLTANTDTVQKYLYKVGKVLLNVFPLKCCIGIAIFNSGQVSM